MLDVAATFFVRDSSDAAKKPTRELTGNPERVETCSAQIAHGQVFEP
jgi:hypothetical protein